MNRDNLPDGAVLALAAGEMMATARRLTARLPRLAESDPKQLAAAVAVVRAGLSEMWADVPPEAARDVMLTAAKMAREHGATTVPGSVAEMLPGELDGAEGMLELTGEWIAAGKPEPANGALTPPDAFASSVAFDRDEDRKALSSLSVLLTLAHLAIPGRAGLDSDDWFNPDTGRPSCPACQGFGYLDDQDETECSLCDGSGGASTYAAGKFFDADEGEEPEPEDYDPGPEIDDEGGMSEYRHMPHEPEPWS